MYMCAVMHGRIPKESSAWRMCFAFVLVNVPSGEAAFRAWLPRWSVGVTLHTWGHMSFWRKATPAGCCVGRSQCLQCCCGSVVALQLQPSALKMMIKCSVLPLEFQGCGARLVAGSTQMIYRERTSPTGTGWRESWGSSALRRKGSGATFQYLKLV